jgi:hypothetical protein
VKGYRHDHLFFVGRDLFVGRDWRVEGNLDRDLGADAALCDVGHNPEAPSKTAFRTQTTDGSPSSIFCHVLPSSREPKSCPLRVPK